MKPRRIAASHVVLPTGETFCQHVVELIDNRLVDHYPLHGEQPGTEWHQGTVCVTPEGVFLITTLADGTQHRRQL